MHLDNAHSYQVALGAAKNLVARPWLDSAMTRSSRDLIEPRTTGSWPDRFKLIIDTSHKSNSVAVGVAGPRVESGAWTHNETRLEERLRVREVRGRTTKRVGPARFPQAFKLAANENIEIASVLTAFVRESARLLSLSLQRGRPDRRRTLADRYFNKFNHFRRVATRFDKLARNFLAAVLLDTPGLKREQLQSLRLRRSQVTHYPSPLLPRRYSASWNLFSLAMNEVLMLVGEALRLRRWPSDPLASSARHRSSRSPPGDPDRSGHRPRRARRGEGGDRK